MMNLKKHRYKKLIVGLLTLVTFMFVLGRSFNVFSQQRGSKDCRFKVDDGSIRATKILLFMDSAYVDVFFNWLNFYEEACGSSPAQKEALVIYCMDNSEGYKYAMSERGVSCSPESIVVVGDITSGGVSVSARSHKQQLGDVWIKRLEIVRRHLSRGEDVLLTDSDAVWLQNPFPRLAQQAALGKDEDTHIIASRGIFPFDLGKKWGAAMCMGFVYFKASNFNVDLITHAVTDMYAIAGKAAQHTNSQVSNNNNSNSIRVRPPPKPDDQVAINSVLDMWGVQWTSNGDSTHSTSSSRSSRSSSSNSSNSSSNSSNSSSSSSNRRSTGPMMETLHNNNDDSGVIVRNGTRHRVVLLSHAHFMRYCEAAGGPGASQLSVHKGPRRSRRSGGGGERESGSPSSPLSSSSSYQQSNSNEKEDSRLHRLALNKKEKHLSAVDSTVSSVAVAAAAAAAAAHGRQEQGQQRRRLHRQWQQPKDGKDKNKAARVKEEEEEENQVLWSSGSSNSKYRYKWDKVIVAHCRVLKSTGKGGNKMTEMKRMGLWK